MTTQPPGDFSHLPPPVPVEETAAHQLEDEERYGGPGGGGDAVDGDSD